MLLKESIDIIRESEYHLQSEISRKSEFLQMFENLCELHKNNDSNIRNLLIMYDQRIENYDKDGITNELTENGEIVEGSESIVDIRKENFLLREIAQSAPLIMQVFDENLMLKEKMREIEYDDTVMEFNIQEKLEHNLLFLMEIATKLDDSIKQRQILSDKLEKLGWWIGISPDELGKAKDLSRVRLELYGKIEGLNFEILRYKQQIKDEERKNSVIQKE